jgi:hypothetical protein
MFRLWLSREWKAIVTILLLFTALIAFGLFVQIQNSGKFEPVPAIITGLSNDGSYSGIYTSSKIVVVATTEEGLIGRVSVEPARVRGCAIGDAVRAEQKDSFVRIYPRPCSK